jgi:hypothetical protein
LLFELVWIFGTDFYDVNFAIIFFYNYYPVLWEWRT